MRRSIVQLLAALCASAALLVPGCGEGAEEENAPVKNDYPVIVAGVEIAACPQKVVSLSPAITDLIFTLGSDAQLVGVSDQCLPEKELPRFGSAALPDTDGILEAGADLVLAASALPARDRDRLAERGVPVVAVSVGTSYEALADCYAAVARAMSGAITGEKNARNTFSRIDGRIRTVKNTLKGQSASAVLLLGDGIVATPDTFAGEMLTFAGLRNAAQEGEGFVCEYETLAAADPDVIFCPQELVESVRADERFAQTKAVQSGRVYAVNPFFFERPGENLALGVELMAARAYPDLVGLPAGAESSAGAEDVSPADSGAEPAAEGSAAA